MRISIRHDWDIPANDVFGMTVLVDGKDISDECIEADDELGYALCLAKGANGKPFVDERTREPATEKKTGKVQIFDKEGVEL